MIYSTCVCVCMCVFRGLECTLSIRIVCVTVTVHLLTWTVHKRFQHKPGLVQVTQSVVSGLLQQANNICNFGEMRCVVKRNLLGIRPDLRDNGLSQQMKLFAPNYFLGCILNTLVIHGVT